MAEIEEKNQLNDKDVLSAQEPRGFNPFTDSCPDSSCACHGCYGESCSWCVSYEQKKACGYHACPLA